MWVDFGGGWVVLGGLGVNIAIFWVDVWVAHFTRIYDKFGNLKREPPAPPLSEPRASGSRIKQRANLSDI
jgi:hypothetical protein